MQDPQITRTLVVDTNPFTRKALVTFLDELDICEIVGQADAAPVARELCERMQPDLVALKLPLDSGQGFTLLPEFRKMQRHTQLLVVMDDVREEDVEHARRHSPLALMHSHDVPRELAAALNALLRGEPFASQRVVQRLLTRRPAATAPHPRVPLSDRELEVFTLFRRGPGPKEIADNLGLSVKTIETYLERLREKFRVRTNAELRGLAS